MKPEEEAALHRKLAEDLFNLVWKLVETPERTRQQTDEMIHASHASRYHWGLVGTPVNWARGEWLLSRVYCALDWPVSARYHAKRALEICDEHKIAGLDLAYAYEGMARAMAAAGRKHNAERYFRLAQEAGQSIPDKDDRDLFFADLDTIPR